MNERWKSIAWLGAIAGLWVLMPQVAQAQVEPVPEPASLTLLAGGVAATIFAAWRKRK